MDTHCVYCDEVIATFRNNGTLRCGHHAHISCIMEHITRINDVECPSCHVDCSIGMDHDPHGFHYREEDEEDADYSQADEIAADFEDFEELNNDQYDLALQVDVSDIEDEETDEETDVETDEATGVETDEEETFNTIDVMNHAVQLISNVSIILDDENQPYHVEEYNAEEGCIEFINTSGDVVMQPETLVEFNINIRIKYHFRICHH